MIRHLLLLLALTSLGASFENEFTLDNPVNFFGVSRGTVYVSQTENYAHICFESSYTALNPECISLIGKRSVQVQSMKGFKQSIVKAELSADISTIPTEAESKIKLIVVLYGNQYSVNIYSAGAHSGVVITTQGMGANILIRKGEQELVNGNTGQKFAYDLSGCRKDDGTLVLYKAKTDLSKCKKETCDTPGEVKTTGCGDEERCVSGSCKAVTFCTFIGPAVIDINNVNGEINDQCDYYLLKLDTISGFSVKGTYKDRRRKSVSFLDTVVITHDSTTYILKQGGVVLEGTTALTLTDQPLAKGSWTFTKDAKGVTAKFIKDKINVIIFFNGYTAQIDITGHSATDLGLKHLCASAKSDVATVRATTGSCEKKHIDAPNPSITCTAASTRCGSLNTAAFESCKDHVKKLPYYTACEKTLCVYPVADDLACFFFEAYSRACSLHGGPGVTGWRTPSNCPTENKALCQDKPCASIEFCGQIGEQKEWKCLCRSVSVAKYRDEDSLGDATTCGAGSASATLINCLLVEKDIDYTTLQLNAADCTGKLEDGKVTFEFDNTKTCDAEITNDNGAVNYKNTIKNKVVPGQTIQRQDPVDIDFACDFASPKLQLMSFKVTGSSSAVNKPVKSGKWEYTLTMKAFANEELTETLTSVTLDQRVWIQLKATGVDSKMSAVLFDNCWATKQAEPEIEPKYFLVKEGCKEDPTVELVGNGAGVESVFSFKTFQFPNSDSEVFLHCKVSLCGIKKDKPCLPDCSKKNRRRRSAKSRLEDDSSLLTMAWKN